MTASSRPHLSSTSSRHARRARRSITLSASADVSSRSIGPASVLRSAAIVGAAFVVSRILGLLREVILGYQFGTSGEYDAYVAAFRVPDLLFLVIMSGAFGSAFIPVFAGKLTLGDREAAWRLASAVINLAGLAILVTAALVFVLADPLVRYLIAPGLAAGDQVVCVKTMRILLLSPIMLGFGIAAKGILEAHQRFELPAYAPVIYNAAIIGGALALGPTMGVYGVAVGVVIGALGHLAIQLPGLFRAGMRYTPTVNFQTDGLAQVGRLLLPRVIGQAAFQVNFIAVTYFASHAGEERVSALNYAWQLMMLPHGILALSISTVIFPAMAQLFAEGRTDELQATFGRALRPLLFLSVPASLGLFLFRTAIVQTIFQWGAFNARSTELVAQGLLFLALGLVFYALVEILTRVYYAMHDTRTPVIAALVIIALNIALSALLVGPLDLAGLALSLTATTGVEALILIVVLQRRIGILTSAFAAWFARLALAVVPMALLATAIAGQLDRATTPGIAARPFQLGLLICALALTAWTFGIAAHALRLPELLHIVDRLAARDRRLARALSLLLGRHG